jgi:hypothetical protein
MRCGTWAMAEPSGRSSSTSNESSPDSSRFGLTIQPTAMPSQSKVPSTTVPGSMSMPPAAVQAPFRRVVKTDQ